jgi:hypothetical protein
VPVRYILPRFGLSGIIGDPVGKSIAYRLNYSVNQLGQWSNYLDLDFDWALHQLNANIEAAHGSSRYRAYGGLGWDRDVLHTGYSLEEDNVTVARLYGGLLVHLTDQVGVDAAVMISGSGRRTAIKGALSTRWQLNSANQIQTSVSYSQRRFEEDNRPWFWTRQGYQLLADHNIDYTIFGQLRQSGQITGDIAWRKTVGNRLGLEVAGDYRSFLNFNLERMSYQYNTQDYSLTASPAIYGDRQGQVGGFHISLVHRSRTFPTQRFYYGYQTFLSGDRLFRREWQAIPGQKATLQLSFAPVSGFSIWAMLSWLSSAQWTDYEGIDGSGYSVTNNLTVTYRSTVKPMTFFDVHIQKWFWHRRLAGSLLLRNLFNQELRYHPFGAAFDLSFIIQIKLRLGREQSLNG